MPIVRRVVLTVDASLTDPALTSNYSVCSSVDLCIPYILALTMSRLLFSASFALLVFGVCVSAGTTPSCLTRAARLDCEYGDQASCQQNNCCWAPILSERTANLTQEELAAPKPHLLAGTPWCFKQQTLVGGYLVTSISPYTPSPTQNPGWNIELGLFDGPSYFGTDVVALTVQVTFETAGRIRVNVSDPSTVRWEIPSSILPLAPIDSTINVDDLNYEFSYTPQPFGFAITRVEDGEVIFNTTAPHPHADGIPLFNGLVFTDQYIEISTQLPNTPAIYGLGEKVTSLMLASDGQPITFWARDLPSPPDMNIYGNHPFYLENRQTGSPLSTKTHGVWLRNSNGMDVLLYDGAASRADYARNHGLDEAELDESQQWGYMSYRVTGGILDFFIYVGSGATSKPEAITQQYHVSVGFPHMPPFWALGFHQCRW